MSNHNVGAAPVGSIVVPLGRRGSILIPRRSLIAMVVLTVVILGLVIPGLAIGASSHGIDAVVDVLTGVGSRAQRLVILEWRAPRLILGIIVGITLGMAGAIFQTVTKNPLGSPDIVGFTMGAQTGILVAVLVVNDSLLTASGAGLIGGLITGAVIFALSVRGGFGGLRLILAGIAISAMLGSLNRWLILRAPNDLAYGAMRSVTGTLADATVEVTVFAAVALLFAGGLALLTSRRLRNLELGNDMAAVLGTDVTRTQASQVLIGTALVAIATTAAGPIGFVALAAPHLARLCTGAAVAPLLSAGLMGAVIVTGADIASRGLLDSLPVGAVTTSVGGMYLLAMLVVEARRTR